LPGELQAQTNVDDAYDHERSSIPNMYLANRAAFLGPRESAVVHKS
jgi:hypothetical protein